MQGFLKSHHLIFCCFFFVPMLLYTQKDLGGKYEQSRSSRSRRQKDAERVLEVVLGALTKALSKGQPVKLAGFGAFTVRSRKARIGVKPGTTEKIKIPATKVVGFKASKTLKEKVR
ncbi:MAG: HU family DNA-binding protein [Bacilli bacterium]